MIMPFLVLFIALIVSFDAVAQHKMFAVSGQGRGSQADAQQSAKISKLESENIDRKAETTENADDIAGQETRISANESELATIQPHAKAGQQSCVAGELIQWNGSVYSCVPEADPLLGEHGKASNPPPDCHDVNAKLLWNATTLQWECEEDMQSGNISLGSCVWKNDFFSTARYCDATCGGGQVATGVRIYFDDYSGTSSGTCKVKCCNL